MPTLAFAQKNKKPNILVIWGDDIGWSNVGFNNNGMMGYKTPNIDRIAKEGAVFTDWYAQQSCTAGRAAFILGQHPFRTGLLTIGMPGSEQGIKDNQPTIAEVLKPHGYVSGQFGKNHLGDRDEHLPTQHGFDEFFGNLYHLNAEEEPEGYYYPKDPEFRKNYGPRGVLKSSADGRVQDTGPLTKKRMETVDEEFEAAAIAFIEKAHKDGKPFFVWLNATRMHVWTHLKEESEGVTGIGIYADGMVEHDKAVGRVLAKLEELGIIDNTIIMYSTDNGAEKISWPDGGSTPFRGEKGTTWEGGFRVPTAIRWPGVIKPGTVYNDIFSHEDMMPTLAAAAGEPKLVEKMLKGYKANGKTFNCHLDGYNLMPYFQGEESESPRKEIFYFDAGGNMNAIRYGMWKLHFTIQEGNISTAYRKSPSWPLVINLRADPYEVSPESGMYIRWYAENMWLFVPAQQVAGKFLSTFKDYPPVLGSSLSVDKVVQSMTAHPKGQ
ncbi:arylsulfatase [Reichenbachiella carrageenanivorans]|uniref:Arylsulfatase n=1 Tax=Reichenbachiella carrageenanivorans TaxID=2979869 RepID=A0ABY6CXZ3_9BACT|nr:arylsulfatase [Reichenbachiella carrageenanivorans]UXX78782.1 arylsulfatase [Reichenbachiella carrageenanivorans]